MTGKERVAIRAEMRRHVSRLTSDDTAVVIDALDNIDGLSAIMRAEAEQ